MQARAQLDRLLGKLAESEATAEPVDNGEPTPGQQPEQRDADPQLTLAALLAEAWDALRRRDYAALRALCGVAPITKRSGKSRVVVRRHACHPRLGNAVYHWARVASQCDPVCKARYKALRERGHSRGRALRAVADRLLNIACSMLRSRTLYDPAFTTQEPAC